jgi:hypothetical protein
MRAFARAFPLPFLIRSRPPFWSRSSSHSSELLVQYRCKLSSKLILEVERTQRT